MANAEHIWRDHLALGARLDMIQSAIRQTGGPQSADADEYRRLMHLYEEVEADYIGSYTTYNDAKAAEGETRRDWT
jgi:hypothetical protein